MQWTDIKQIDRLILQTKSLGAAVEEIGVSGEGRSLYGVTIGRKDAPCTVLIVAGFHADEVIAPLAALSILQTIVRCPVPAVRFCIVPVADPDLASRNASELSETVNLQALLRLNHQRDLEGHFTADTYPECIAIRQWVEQLDRVDAYFSLHSAHCISPGLFFYVSSTSKLSCVLQAANQVAATKPEWVPLLVKDPTQISQKALAPGFFEMDIPKPDQIDGVHPGSSIAFITHRFRPQYAGVPEMPLAVCPALANASLAEIDQCNREFKETGRTSHSVRAIDLDIQLHIIQNWIGAVIEQVAVSESNP